MSLSILPGSHMYSFPQGYGSDQKNLMVSYSILYTIPFSQVIVICGCPIKPKVNSRGTQHVCGGSVTTAHGDGSTVCGVLWNITSNGFKADAVAKSVDNITNRTSCIFIFTAQYISVGTLIYITVESHRF